LENGVVTKVKTGTDLEDISISFHAEYWHIEDGWRRFVFLHYNCPRRV